MEELLRFALVLHIAASAITAIVAFINLKTLKEIVQTLDSIIDRESTVYDPDPQPDAHPKKPEELLMERLSSTIGRSYSGHK